MYVVYFEFLYTMLWCFFFYLVYRDRFQFKVDVDIKV